MAGRKCSVCAHPQAKAIDKALRAGESTRSVATRHGINEASLRRHKATHTDAIDAPKATHFAMVAAERTKPPEVVRRPRGRPTEYTEEAAQEVCARIAAGETLRAICREDGMPEPATVRTWAMDNREGFAARYATARAHGADAIAEQMLEMADTPLIGEKSVTKLTGVEITTGDAVERSKLGVDTRKWLLSRWAPKAYGEKSSLEVSGPDGAPLVQIYLPGNARDTPPKTIDVEPETAE